MLQDYWWLIFIGLVLLALLILWLILGRRKGVGSQAAASLRDLDGTRAAQPTFARRDPMAVDAPVPPPSPLFEPLTRQSDPAPAEHTRADDDALTSASDAAGSAGPSVAAEAAAMDDAGEPYAAVEGDDLLRMKGLGPKLGDRLAELGVTRFDQIASWDEADIDRIDEQLGTFRGRIRRDKWLQQARFLAAGDTEGYQAAFGALR